MTKHVFLILAAMLINAMSLMAQSGIGGGGINIDPYPCMEIPNRPVNIIPDEIFKQELINLGVDTNNDGIITCSEARAYNGEIVLQSKGIESIQGIVQFRNITKLDVYNNKIKGHLDLSVLKKLKSVNLSGNTQLTSVNMANGNNANMLRFGAQANLSLRCVQIDKSFTPNGNWNIDSWATFSTECADCWQPQITVLTNKAAGQTIKIGVSTKQPNANIWIDLNGNATKDPGEEVKPGDYADAPDEDGYPNEYQTYTIQNQLITIYGKVEYLTFNDANWEASSDHSDLKFIKAQHNPYLKELICIRNENLETVKLNSNIEKLYINNSKIGDIDLSQCSKLKTMYLNNAKLNGIDISICTELTSLEIFGNEDITELDISNNTELTNLDIGETKISSIDISKHTKLKYFEAHNCEKLVSIDVTNNTELTKLDLSYSGINCINLDNNLKLSLLNLKYTKIAMLDISHLKDLWKLVCGGNNLKALNLANGNNGTKLKRVEVIGNGINGKCINVDPGFPATAEADNYWKKPATAFWGDNCKPNTQPYMQLTTEIAVGNSIELQIKPYEGEQLSNCWIDLNNNDVKDPGEEVPNEDKNSYTINSQTFKIYGKISRLKFEARQKITKFYTNRNPYLRELLFKEDTKLSGLDVSKNPELRELVLWNCAQTQLDVSKNKKLQRLDVWGDPLTQLDVSNNTELVKLDCGATDLTQLDVSKNLKLEELYCVHNQLTQLDLSQNSKLKILRCYKNGLTQLNLSSNTKLVELLCQKNQISSLTINSDKLKKVIIYGNQLDACALNAFYYALPNTTEGNLVISYSFPPNSPTYNPGQVTSHIQAAIDKGWKIYCDGGEISPPPGDNTGCSQPAFAISSSAHNFGKVFLNSLDTVEFTISNPGSQPLNISSSSISGTHSSLFKSNLNDNTTIAAGKKASFKVEYRPTFGGAHTATLTIETNDANSPHTIQLSGTGKKGHARFTISANEHNFGKVPVNKKVTQTLTVSNTNGTAPLKVTNITSDNSHFKVSPTNFVIGIDPASANTKEITITYRPGSKGAEQALISFETNVGIHGIQVKGEGTVPAFVATPSSLDFKGIKVGTTAQKTITIKNTGEAALKISKIVSNKAAFTVSPATLEVAAGASAKVTISFKPTTKGAQSATISFTDNAGNHTVAVKGKGTVPKFAATPSSLDFASVKVGKTAQKTITIKNTGEGALRISKIVSNKAVFTVSPATLEVAAGASAKVTVSFKPTAAGAQSATISFTDNAGNHTVAVKGKGDKPNAIENVNASQVSIYPNPSSGHFFVDVPNAGNLQVMSLSGKLVETKKLQEGKNEVNINKPGVYLLKIAGKDFSVVKKIIVK